MSEATHLVIGTPCFGGNVTHRYTLSLLKLQESAVARGVRLSFRLLRGDALIARARNIIVGDFLGDPSATHLLFIDADLGFEPDQVWALLESGRDVAAAVYPLKNLDWPKLRAAAEPAGAFAYAVEFLDPAKVVPVGRFARARYVGGGFMMVRRSVFERMAVQHPELRFRRSHTIINAPPEGPLHAFFDTLLDPESGYYLSEDYTFCRRWTDMGGEIWVDLESRLTHIGPVDFEGDLMQVLRPAGS
jgi:hypothetical protein